MEMGFNPLRILVIAAIGHKGLTDNLVHGFQSDADSVIAATYVFRTAEEGSKFQSDADSVIAATTSDDMWEVRPGSFNPMRIR